MSFWKSKKFHETLIVQDAKLSAINKSQAVIEFDLNGIILDANQNFLNAMGYALDEIKGRHHRIFVTKEYAESTDYKEFWKKLSEGHTQAAEFMRLNKQGEEVWIQASYNPMFDDQGKLFRIVKFATDITEQKKKSADFEGQIKAISKSQAVIEFNPDGTIISANQNFLDCMGYTLKEIVGRHHRIFVDGAYSNSREYQEFWDNLRRGVYQMAQYKRLGKGGREVWIQASYNPVFGPSGKLMKVVKYASDITNRRKISEEIDQQFSGVAQALNDVKTQTSTASNASSQTSNGVQMVAAAVDELNNSIREISSNINCTQNTVTKTLHHVHDADKKTVDLSAGASSMTSVIEFIQDIASNINLLALNATIESARAGEAGKGFAVVASEVKNLAGQVAHATKKISQEIINIQSVSVDVVETLTSIKKAIADVEVSVNTVASAVEEQSVVTHGILSNMQLAATAVADVNQNLHDIRCSSQTLSDDSQTLMTLIKQAIA